MSQPSIQYKPLVGERAIRLVHVIQDEKAHHGFKVQLTEHSFDGGVVFNALSYTWGLPYYKDFTEAETLTAEVGQTFTINCDETHVNITENLFFALQRLISDSNGEPITPIWIDALSINQTDDLERASQVSMMSDIYSTASSVIVWLGKEDPPERFLKMHDNEALEKWMTDVAIRNLDPIPPPTALTSMGLSSIEDWQDMWWDYVSFYRRQRYFRRVWIIQETSLAQSITVLCGSHTLDWTRLVVIGNLLLVSNVGNHWTLLGKRSELLMNVKGWMVGNEIRSLHMFRTDHRINGGLPMHLHQTKANFMRGRQDLRENDSATEAMLSSYGSLGDPKHKEYAYFAWVLRQFSDYQTTDKRDHVFAALAFCRPFFRRANMPPPITPTYSTTVQDIYTLTTTALLTHLPNLALLSFNDVSHKELPSLPTWVPDFSASFPNRPYISRGFVVDPTSPSLASPIYNASSVPYPPPPQSHPFATASANNTLRLRGIRLDTITEICPAAFDSSTKFNYTPYLDFIATHLPPLYDTTDETRIEALWRTLFGNYNQTEMEYPASMFIGMGYFKQHVLENVAIHVIAKMNPEEGVFGGEYLAEMIRVSTVLSLLAMTGEGGEVFLPNAIEVAVKIMEYTALVMQGGSEGEIQARLGTSVAEIECISMFGLGMAVPMRRLFVTGSSYLGLGPKGVERDDEVWVVEGARVPFVLRKEGEKWRLLGEAYLHGFMDGEGVDGGWKDLVVC
ncbi:hypothetical protein OQA88_1415 [Cercophora sp. LCS_1]